MAADGPAVKLFNNKKEQETYENLGGSVPSCALLALSVLLHFPFPFKLRWSQADSNTCLGLTFPTCRPLCYLEDNREA